MFHSVYICGIIICLFVPYEDVIGLGGTPGSVGFSARKCRGQRSKVSPPVQFRLIYMCTPDFGTNWGIAHIRIPRKFLWVLSVCGHNIVTR